jgi:putative flippase GtrA
VKKAIPMRCLTAILLAAIRSPSYFILIVLPLPLSMRKVHDFIRRTIFNVIDLFYMPFKKWMPLHTFRYAACGGGNVVFDITLFSFCYNFIFKKQNLHLGAYTLSPHIASLALSFSISFCTGFYLNRYIVFKESGLSKRGQLSRFIMVNAICILLNVIFLKVLVDWLGIYPTPSKIIATVFIACFSYFSQTHFFFKAKKTVA